MAGTNATQHFVGSFRADIYGLSNGMVRIEVSNVTHFQSLLYHIPGVPSWAREEFKYFGTITQKFIWTEKIGPFKHSVHIQGRKMYYYDEDFHDK